MHSNITTVFFDAGGVLFDTKIHRDERIRRILKARGFDDGAIEKGICKGEEFNDLFLKSAHRPSSWKEEEAYWDNYYKAILSEIENADIYSLQKQLLYQTHYAINCVLFSEVVDVLNHLHGKYKLGVISNALPSMDWIFDLLDIRKYFSSITISAFVGIEKPEKGIYECALNSLGVKAEECVFIDDKQENILASNELGFTGIHLDRRKDNLEILKQVLNNNMFDIKRCV